MSFKMDESIQKLFRWPLFIFQLFGFMPVQGIFYTDTSALKFSWVSFRTVYAILTFLGFIFLMFEQVARFFVYELNMLEIQRFWYFLKSTVISILFLQLAKNWSEFIKIIQFVEKQMVHYDWPKPLKNRVRMVFISFVIALFIDYFLIQIHRVREDITQGNVTFNLKTWKHFQKDRVFNYVYDFLPYNFFSGLLLLVAQIQVLLAGTFNDLFIVVTSLILSARQEQLTEKIRIASKSGVSSEFKWMQLREDYNRLEKLCKFINSHIGLLVLTSFAGNLGLILIQLFNSLNINRSVLGKVYLFYAIFFILFKVIAVCMFGSMVNEESKKPLKYLYSAVGAAYNVEIDRLIRQISRDAMALSGIDIFHIKRNIVLKIAGSIVTYELVVIQFAGDFIKEKETGNSSYTL